MTYEVTLLLVVNPSRDIDLDQPETKRVEFNVPAENENDAIRKAKELDESGLSIWESWAQEKEVEAKTSNMHPIFTQALKPFGIR